MVILPGRRAGFWGNDGYTKLLLHFDGADGTTTTIDSSRSGHAVTLTNATIDTAQSVFGGSSILSSSASSHSARCAAHADWNMAGDFTIDFWVRFASLPESGSSFGLMYNGTNEISDYNAIYLLNTAGTYSWVLQSKAGSADVVMVNKNSSPNVEINAWYHAAFVHSGTNYLVFQGGTQCGTTVVDADNMTDYSAATFNVLSSIAAGGFLNGWVDEFRYSLGIARWTAAFTPPSAAYR